MSRKNNKYVGTTSTKEIKKAFLDVFDQDIHPWPWPGVNYFRDARPKSGFIRYKIMFTGFTFIQLRKLGRMLPGATVKAWKTQKWALGRGQMVICIYVPIDHIVEKPSLLRRGTMFDQDFKVYNELAKLGRCF